MAHIPFFRTRYGIDAPSVVRRLFLTGIVYPTVGVVMYFFFLKIGYPLLENSS